MYKLLPILKEIKIINKITPEILGDLYSTIWKGRDGSEWDKISDNGMREWKNNIIKYLPHGLNKKYPYYQDVNKKYLPRMYNDLIKFKQKYNL